MIEDSLIDAVNSAWMLLHPPSRECFSMLEWEMGSDAVECLSGKTIVEVENSRPGFDNLTLQWLPADAAAYYLGTYLYWTLQTCKEGQAGKFIVWGYVARQNIFSMLSDFEFGKRMMESLPHQCLTTLMDAAVYLKQSSDLCRLDRGQVEALYEFLVPFVRGGFSESYEQG